MKNSDRFSRTTANEKLKAVYSAQEMDVNNTLQRIFGRVHLISLTQIPDDQPGSSFAYFGIGDSVVDSRKFRTPCTLLDFHRVFRIIDQQVVENPHRSNVLCAEGSAGSQTAAALMLGAYMIMRLDMQPGHVMWRLKTSLRNLCSGFDFCWQSEQVFGLRLEDCLDALSKAKTLRWLDFSEDGFDPDEYKHLDNPLNAGMHEMVPNKLMAMPMPRLVSSETGWEDVFVDGRFIQRNFSPSYFADILDQFDVSTWVQLASAEYGAEALEGTGLVLEDLPCEDCLVPPPEVVERFMAIVEGAVGAVAVQGRVKLGIGGTLIGLYIMKHHGFGGREACAWLRMVRPGW
jgi:hypothetical protein